MNQKVRTIPIKVKVYTSGYTISGSIHTRPGGYKDRVSDILNDPAGSFLSLTQATFQSRQGDGGVAKKAGTIMVRIDDILMLIPFEESKSQEGEGQINEG